MSNRAVFTQTDVTRALKGVRGAGLSVSRIEIDPNGKISIIIGDAEVAGATGRLPNSWDKVFEPDWRDKSPLYNPELATPKGRRKT